MRRYVAACVSISLVGCTSTGLPSVPGLTPKTATQAPGSVETFSYATVADRNLRVSVERVMLAGERDFIPGDPNWLQIKMRLENLGPRTVKLTEVKGRLGDGTTIASAKTIGELMKPPSLAKSQLTTLGVGAGSMVLGMLFPPAAILGGVAIVMAPALERDRMQKKAVLLNQFSLKAEAIAPGTASAGYVFVPAVRGQTGLVVVYEVGGAPQALTLARQPH